jgi:hypothetical protein
MHLTRVFQFTCHHRATRTFAIVPTMATAETIAEVGGRRWRHSEQDVPSSLVDAMGFYPCAPLIFVIQRCPQACLAELGFVAARSTREVRIDHDPAAAA